MIYGYARVSTKGQARDGNSLDAQKAALIEHGVIDDKEHLYIDSFTGTKMSRPQFDELKKKLQKGDTLVVTKIDRFARSLGGASELITDLIDKGVSIHVLNLGVLSNDSVNKLMRNILLDFAEFERDMIVQRTQEGKAVARAKAAERGERFKEGRPHKFDQDKMDFAMKCLETDSYSKVSKMTGISVSTLVRYKRSLDNQKN